MRSREFPASIFYDIKKTFEEQGLEGLKEKTRRKPCVKNRVAQEVEEAVLHMAYEYPAYGQARASNELRKKGVLVSGGGARSIWLRHGLETFKKRLAFLEEKAARKERESHPDEIEMEHPGYLLSQDTFYVGYLKGVGRIYQQTVVGNPFCCGLWQGVCGEGSGDGGESVE